jgi:hypothetical protein
MDIGEGTSISTSAKLDKTNPRGIHIGKYSTVTFGAAIPDARLHLQTTHYASASHRLSRR